MGWAYREYIIAAKNGSSCEEWLSGNDFEAVLVNFCCHEFGANASEAVYYLVIGDTSQISVFSDTNKNEYRTYRFISYI